MPLGFRAPHPFPAPSGSGSWRKVERLDVAPRRTSASPGDPSSHTHVPRPHLSPGLNVPGMGIWGVRKLPRRFQYSPTNPIGGMGCVWPSDLGDQWEGLRNESLGENRREEQPVVGVWLWQWRQAGGMDRGLRGRTGGWGVERSWPRRGQALRHPLDQGKRRRVQHHQGVWLWTLGTREHLQEGTQEKGQVWKQT